MKIGLFTVLLGDKSLEEVLIYLYERGIQTVELGTGGYPGTAHVDAGMLAQDEEKLKELKKLLFKYKIEISGLSCHGNPLHPQPKIALEFQKDFENTIILAEKLGVDRVITFSGCPGDSKFSLYPNWVVCPWPEDFLKILDYQWNEVMIPYWKKAALFANNHGINKICIEMHPGFCVYNPETLLKLREAVGPTIGANFDPSHLFWQGIDPVAAIRELGPAIYHFHAKDTKIDAINAKVNGVLDTKGYSELSKRSWVFRTVGYGHDYQTWKDIVSALRMAGYDHVLSIEHEDGIMTAKEGLQKAIKFLQEVVITEGSDTMWWA